MPTNPNLKKEQLNNPIHRGNRLNDPKYREIQGYNNYELNNTQAISPRFGEVTPFTVFETVPGDRHMLHSASNTVLNQIDAVLYSKVNEYQDYFYVPMRCVFPYNYAKMIPNPTKGDDLPWKALPMIPLYHFMAKFIYSNQEMIFETNDGEDSSSPQASIEQLFGIGEYDARSMLAVNNLLYLGYMLSRGQLLDYLGYSIDLLGVNQRYTPGYDKYQNNFQKHIDDMFNSLLQLDNGQFKLGIEGFDLADTPSSIGVGLNGFNSNYYNLKYSALNPNVGLKILYKPQSADEWTLSGFRAALYDCLERGCFIRFVSIDEDNTIIPFSDALDAFQLFYSDIDWLTTQLGSVLPDDTESEPFSGGYINPLRLAAYQLSVSQYMTNDSVDNIFTADLYMQNLRALMFPSANDITSERTFDYNGVDTEYDLLTTGAFERAFLDPRNVTGLLTRMLPFTSALFFLRRSLRYGDYFATGRPNLLAVGQLGIPVEDASVNPMDVTKMLLMQRYLNASNWVGPKEENYFAAMYNIVPSDHAPQPRFIAHRKIELKNERVTNTANSQGKQSTNLYGATDSSGFDVFIDDFGVIIGVCSYDVLPLYPSGIDRNFYNSDRFSMFNTMLQNVGDQEINQAELTGDPTRYGLTFAYTVRYAQYKFGISRAHGAFVNDLPGYSMLYPYTGLFNSPDSAFTINPDFIRDKPFFFDQFFAQRTGLSPAQYYHFQLPVTNVHSAARRMQYQPPVLF